MDVTEAQAAEQRACLECGRPNPVDSRFCAGCGHPIELGVPTRAPLGVPVADPLVGRIIADRYKILSLIGRGGMGVVYKVEHIRIGKLIAMKLLHGELARDKDIVKRFKNEAEAASKLSHPNTVQIFDFGRSEGLMYLVMEYVSGRDFGFVIQHESPLPFARICKIVAQVCASVAEAHDRGVVHRDIKPENIMVSQTRSQADFVKVLDFGLAKLREHEDAGGGITRAGSLIGTPYYMAPEHIRGDSVDQRVDLYAIGAVLYKAICGVPPFSAPSPVGVLTKHLTDPVVPPSERAGRADVPLVADQIVLKAMQKDPSHRYQRAEELRDDLLAYVESIGENVRDPSSGRVTRSATPTPVPSPSGNRRIFEVATRGDVDRYERRLRRRSRVNYMLGVAVMAAGVVAAYFAWHGPPARQRTTELEPNDVPAKANRLRPGAPVRAFLGKRVSRTESDRDVYVIDNPGGERKAVKIEVTAVPNIDIALDIVRAGSTTPELAVDNQGEGSPEAVPNFLLSGTRYFLQVREVSRSGRYPTENVSDAYTISWEYVLPTPDDEHELNGSLDAFEPIDAGAVKRGFIGWPGDVDTYCLRADARNVTFSVSGVQGTDLVMRVVDRTADSSASVDAGGAGQPERTPAIARGVASMTCVEITASTDREGVSQANPYEAYVLRVESSP